MKRGSALLIVLGMIAFMVISAVAFSALMRNSRLPSSYLRRTSASRHLVKAALAEAIDIIDASIGNDLYPGADDNGTAWSYPRGEGGYIARRNYWRGNCFIGSNQLASASSTVATLSLEGLAYLPPARINEARYYSRHSLAGQWRTLSFDAGRYAFAAVDVSDHLDINRVFADRGRNSSDSGRITLAHIFENDAHTGSGTPSAEDWDTFIEEFNPMAGATVGQNPGSGGKLPLTSLADLNLAINKWQPGWVTAAETLSPFCRFLGSGQDFVVDMSSSARIRQMAFVTDSYLPSTNTAATARYDLCRAQPFKSPRMHEPKQQMSYEEQLRESSDILEHLYDKITELDTVSLCDYLDENDIPTSLALPSVECIPMVYALYPYSSFTMTLQPGVESPNAEARKSQANSPSAPPKLDVIVSYKMGFDGPDGEIQAGLLFPFRRVKKAMQGTSYSVDFAARIGLATGGGPGHHQGGGAFVIGNSEDFIAKQSGAVVQNGVIKIHATAQGTINTDVRNEDGASQRVSATLKLGDVGSWFANNEMFSVTWEYELQNIGTKENPEYDYVKSGKGPKTAKANPNFYPLNANGTRYEDFEDELKAGNAAVKVKPYMTIVARVKSSKSGKYVDVVPASLAADKIYNGIDIEQSPSADNVRALCGDGHALMTLVSDNTKEIVFGEGNWEGEYSENLRATANGGVLICPDPRWNFAPENFYVQTGDGVPLGSAFVDSLDLGSNGRDNDIFLSISDQGYMQSPSEFAFLPRTTTSRLPVSGSPIGDCKNNYLTRTEFAAGGADPYNQLAHGALMWKTYRLYARNGMDDDNLYDLGIRYEGSGYRVSPYTSSRDVLMAALANTPYSWWAASTNLSANANLADESADSFNRSYAFNEMNANAKFAWSDLESVAANLLAAMRGRADGNWALGFHNLDWEGDNSDFCGVNFQRTNADELKDVDRKMLYGFWRDSLAARQQLFLIFVRAEPMMMGGGAIGQTPPQLGARAVALVWRDPAPTAQDVNGQPRPHQTRILFYRQFD